MKLIYTLILLLFSSSVFAEFVFVNKSISDLLDYGFRIKQIDTVDEYTYVYHLRGDWSFSAGNTDYYDVAICHYDGSYTFCKIDTQDKSMVEHLNGDDYLEQLNKELLAEEDTPEISENMKIFLEQLKNTEGWKKRFGDNGDNKEILAEEMDD